MTVQLQAQWDYKSVMSFWLRTKCTKVIAILKCVHLSLCSWHCQAGFVAASHVGGFPTRNSGTGESNKPRLKRGEDCRRSLKLKDLSNMRGFVSHLRVINQMYSRAVICQIKMGYPLIEYDEVWGIIKKLRYWKSIHFRHWIMRQTAQSVLGFSNYCMRERSYFARQPCIHHAPPPDPDDAFDFSNPSIKLDQLLLSPPPPPPSIVSSDVPELKFSRLQSGP